MEDEVIAEALEEIETEHGGFTEDRETGRTAQKCYEDWLIDKDKPQEPQPNEIDILKLEVDTLKSEKQILAQNVLDLTSVVEAMLLGGIE